MSEKKVRFPLSSSLKDQLNTIASKLPELAQTKPKEIIHDGKDLINSGVQQVRTEKGLQPVIIGSKYPQKEVSGSSPWMFRQDPSLSSKPQCGNEIAVFHSTISRPAGRLATFGALKECSLSISDRFNVSVLLTFFVFFVITLGYIPPSSDTIALISK